MWEDLIGRQADGALGGRRRLRDRLALLNGMKCSNREFGSEGVTAALRIGTWNVEYADVATTNARRLKIFDQHPADIWVLTETHDALTPGAGFEAVHALQRPLGGTSVKPGSRWVSIWSRFPVAAATDVQLDNPARTQAALITTPLGDVIMYGTVVPWNGDKGPGPEPARGWDEHHRVLPIQIAEWQALQRAYPRAHLIVAGDLNTDMIGGGYYGTKRGIAMIEDGMRACALFCAAEQPRVERLAFPPIDHVLIPRAWATKARVVDAFEGRIGKPRLSDHSGLVVEAQH